MNKISSWTILGSALVFSVAGHSVTAKDAMNLSVSFSVMRCVTTTSGTDTEVDCQAAPGAVQQNVAIDLSSCGDDGSGGTFCAGSWQQNLTVDGLIFGGAVSIDNDTINGAQPIYDGSISASLATDVNPAITVLFFAQNVPTDSAIMIGTTVQSPADATLSYVPIASAGPVPASLRDLAKRARTTLLARIKKAKRARR